MGSHIMADRWWRVGTNGSGEQRHGDGREGGKGERKTHGSSRLSSAALGREGNASGEGKGGSEIRLEEAAEFRQSSGGVRVSTT